MFLIGGLLKWLSSLWASFLLKRKMPREKAMAEGGAVEKQRHSSLLRKSARNTKRREKNDE
jgi:hypothetical protein